MGWRGRSGDVVAAVTLKNRIRRLSPARWRARRGRLPARSPAPGAYEKGNGDVEMITRKVADRKSPESLPKRKECFGPERKGCR